MKLDNVDVQVICACLVIAQARVEVGEVENVPTDQLQKFLHAVIDLRQRFNNEIARSGKISVVN